MTKITRQKNGYSVISNTALRDPKLSARAKGIYAYIMTLPEDWQIYKEELFKHFKEGRDTLDTALKELKTIGYLEIKRKHENGRLCYEYIFKDQPTEIQDTEIQGIEFQPTEIQPLESSTLLNTEEVITDKSKKINKKGNGCTEEIKKRENDFTTFYGAYPKKRSKPQAYKAFCKHYRDLPTMEDLVGIVNKWKKTEQWQKNNGAFIPYPASWLNAEGWNDDIPEPWIDPQQQAADAAKASKKVSWVRCPDCGHQQRSIKASDQCPVCREYGTAFKHIRGDRYPEGVA